MKNLQDGLRDFLLGFTKAYVIVDALDVCPEKDEEHDKLLRVIRELHVWSCSSLHLLATSRREFDI